MDFISAKVLHKHSLFSFLYEKACKSKSPQKRCLIFLIASSCDLLSKTNLCNDRLNDFKFKL